MTHDDETRLAAIQARADARLAVDRFLTQAESDRAWLLAALARLQAENSSANARFCDQHRGEYATSGCVVCGLIAQGPELHAQHVRAEKAEADVVRLQAERDELRAALQSIADNSCCTPCREAGLFAKQALEGPRTIPAVATPLGESQADPSRIVLERKELHEVKAKTP
jgi:hypothetical protein